MILCLVWSSLSMNFWIKYSLVWFFQVAAWGFAWFLHKLPWIFIFWTWLTKLKSCCSGSQVGNLTRQRDYYSILAIFSDTPLPAETIILFSPCALLKQGTFQTKLIFRCSCYEWVRSMDVLRRGSMWCSSIRELPGGLCLGGCSLWRTFLFLWFCFL